MTIEVALLISAVSLAFGIYQGITITVEETLTLDIDDIIEVWYRSNQSSGEVRCGYLKASIGTAFMKKV
ncbi:MAG: hypothetical protein GX921_07380 [Bacteroidales bacterium]|nr:hypothetical protein [Bacteroidales bacterium]